MVCFVAPEPYSPEQIARENDVREQRERAPHGDDAPGPAARAPPPDASPGPLSPFLLLSSLELSDTKVYET